MQTQLETISRQVHRSFSMMFNPNLSDLFFWHFHPEYELVYIVGANGTRHVGDHISTYTGSDLVLIGSNIPHLNFDYGVKTEYRKVVVHVKQAFVDTHLQPVPELHAISQLFLRSRYGIAFGGLRKEEIGEKLFGLEHLPPFQQYVSLVEILGEIASLPDFSLLHEQPFNIHVSDKEHIRLQALYAFVDQNYTRKIELHEAAQVANMTKEAFCRYFKKATQYTFIEFLNRYRISQSKHHLMAGKPVADACYSSGFESLSYYNRVFKRITKENPSDFRRRYR